MPVPSPAPVNSWCRGRSPARPRAGRHSRRSRRGRTTGEAKTTEAAGTASPRTVIVRKKLRRLTDAKGSFSAAIPTKFMPAPGYSAYVAPEKYAQIAWVLGLSGHSDEIARERLFAHVDELLRGLRPAGPG